MMKKKRKSKRLNKKLIRMYLMSELTLNPNKRTNKWKKIRKVVLKEQVSSNKLNHNNQTKVMKVKKKKFLLKRAVVKILKI
jgi:hypothetical protein